MAVREFYLKRLATRFVFAALVASVTSIYLWCFYRSVSLHIESSSAILDRPTSTVKKSLEIDSLLVGNEVKCDQEAVSPSVSCESDWGWSLFERWLKNQRPVILGGSSVNCAVNEKAYSFCKFSNVTVDFRRVQEIGTTRQFEYGFFSTYGENLNEDFQFDIPGMAHVVQLRDRIDESAEEYDSLERRPSFIISNDDIFNLGHYMNDVMNVWHMSLMAGKNLKSSLLINIDGFRAQGPAGGDRHRLMMPADPDNHGPYIGYYDSWFSEIKKATDYKKKRVKYAELYVPSNPYFPWFWNDWWSANQCALISSSPLYQSFNLFLRKRWIERYGNNSLPLPDNDKVHVVIELRPIDFTKTNEHSRARHISNIPQLVERMNLIPNIRVTAMDFTTLPFREQVALSHSAGVFVSMHGAGTTHIFHSALGAPNCCALLELQPEKKLGYQHAYGYANIARMYGLHYFRHTVEDGKTTENGTALNLSLFISLLTEAVEAVRVKPTCLGDVRDTRDSATLGFQHL